MIPVLSEDQDFFSSQIDQELSCGFNCNKSAQLYLLFVLSTAALNLYNQNYNLDNLQISF